MYSYKLAKRLFVPGRSCHFKPLVTGSENIGTKTEHQQKRIHHPAKASVESFTFKQRFELRLEQSLKILNELGKWMADTQKEVLPKSPIGQAIAYCIPRWDNLLNYLHDGSFEIDNNLAENAMRPIARGR